MRKVKKCKLFSLFFSDLSENIQLVDAIADEEYVDEDNNDVLMCNSVKMIREKLRIEGM